MRIPQSTTSRWPHRSLFRIGFERVGFTPRTPEDGFSGTVGTIWADGQKMTNARSRDGKPCSVTLPNSRSTAAREILRAGPSRDRLSCIGPMTAGQCDRRTSAGRLLATARMRRHSSDRRLTAAVNVFQTATGKPGAQLHTAQLGRVEGRRGCSNATQKTGRPGGNPAFLCLVATRVAATRLPPRPSAFRAGREA